MQSSLRTAWFVRGGAFAFLAVLAVAGCSLLVGQDAAQCQVDADCARFVGTRCVAGGCVRPQSTFDAAVDPNLACTSTQDCLALHGTNWVCRSTRCAKLGSDDCGIVLGNYTADDVLLLGAILPIYHSHASTGLPIERALTFAADEDFQAGVPFGTGGTGDVRHPVAVILCDEGVNPVRAAHHLVDDVHVPAIFGPASGQAVLDVAAVTNGARVLLMSPFATADLSPVTGPGLVWRTAPGGAAEGAAMAAVVSATLEPRIRAATGKPSIAVTIVYRDDVDTASVHESLKASLRFNGLPAVANGGLFDDVTYGNPDVVGDDHTSDALTRVTGAVPDLVIVLGWTEGVTTVISEIESQTLGDATHPYYLVSHGLQIAELLALTAPTSSGDLKARILVTSPGENAATNAPLRELFLRYRSTFSDAPAETFGMAQGYDAFYLLAYGLSAVRNLDIEGRDIAQGLSTILFGSGPVPIEVRPQSIPAALDAIRAGTPIALQGTSGSLAFDPATGTAPSNVQVSCITSPSAGVATFASAGLTWNVTTAALDGALSTACLK